MLFFGSLFQASAEVGDDRRFGAEVAAVGDDDALSDGFLGVVVFDITCEVKLGTGVSRQFDEASSATSEKGDAADDDVRIAGIGQGIAMKEAFDFLQDVHSRFRCRPGPDAAHHEGMTGIFQRIQVIRRFFIGMSGQHGLYGLTELAFGDYGFDPFFCRFFDLPDFTDKGMRPFMGFETAFAFGRKGTVAVVADIAGTGVGQGLADGVTMAFRDVDGDFIEFIFGDGDEALQIRQAQEAGQDVVDAAVGTIQVGMGAVDGNVVGQEFLVHAAVYVSVRRDFKPSKMTG